jgi:transposase
MNTRIPVVLHIGADVAKDEVVVACEEEAFAPRALPNERRALLGWLKTLPAGSYIGMESTGRYHQLLAGLAFELGLRVYVLNPRDCWHYAKGVGLRAKTDRVDARLLARIIAREAGKLHPWCAPSVQQEGVGTVAASASQRQSHASGTGPIAGGAQLLWS